jgi:hypothetical protein
MARDVDPSYNTGAGSARAEAECSGSIEEHCLPSQFSKPYLMYSATDAASAAVDFAKGSLEDGVVNSPPSRDAARLHVCSPSPLRGYGSTPTRQCSYSPIKGTLRTPQRQLYCKAAPCSTDKVNGVSVGPPSKSRASHSHVSRRRSHGEKGGCAVRTQSLSSQPSPPLSSSDLVLVGRNAHASRRQSYPEPSLFSLSRRSRGREQEQVSTGTSWPMPYSRRDEIMRGMAKLKAREMGSVESKNR